MLVPTISGHTINDSVEVLERVQSIDYSIDIPRADVSQFRKRRIDRSSNYRAPIC